MWEKKGGLTPACGRAVARRVAVSDALFHLGAIFSLKSPPNPIHPWKKKMEIFEADRCRDGIILTIPVTDSILRLFCMN